MTRYTTFKLENIICNDYQTVANSIDTSDSILDQRHMHIPYITDQFGIIKMQTDAHSRLIKEQHARKILYEITKSDY